MALVGLLVAIATVVVIVVSTSTDSRPRPDTSAADNRRAGIQALLDEWAAAVREGDVETLRSLFDPQATEGFLDREVRRAQNLAAVPLSDWGFEFGSVADPARGGSNPGADEVATPVVYLRYAIDGPDSAPTRKPVALTVARRGDEWKLLSDRAIGDRTTWRGPWDFGPVVAATVDVGGRRSVVLGHPDQQAMVDALAAELVSAIPAVTAVWGTDWPGAAVVVVADSRPEFAELAGSRQGNLDVAAVSVADAVSPGAVPSGQRVVFGPQAVERLTETTRRSVLRHELTHVAARSATVDGSPMWVLEGFADYVGYRAAGLSFKETAPLLAAGGPPSELPPDADFAAAETAQLAYEKAWSANAFVADQFGEPALVQLYRMLSQGPADSAAVDTALHAVLGVPLPDFVDRWGKWIVDALGAQPPG